MSTEPVDSHAPQPDAADGGDAAVMGGTAMADAAAADAAATEPPATEPAATEPTIESLQAEVRALTDQHSRAVADYQNLRRRSVEDRVQQARMLEADLIRRYLPVLDDLDRAIGSVEDEADIREHNWVEGIRMVLRKFEQVLASHGVEEIAALDQEFDPTQHEALGYVPGPAGRVIHLVHRGYRLGDVTVRPAAVMVGGGEDDAPA